MRLVRVRAKADIVANQSIARAPGNYIPGGRVGTRTRLGSIVANPRVRWSARRVRREMSSAAPDAGVSDAANQVPDATELSFSPGNHTGAIIRTGLDGPKPVFIREIRQGRTRPHRFLMTGGLNRGPIS